MREQAERDKRSYEAAEQELKAVQGRRLEELRQQHEVDRGTAEAAWAVAKAETQQQWMHALQQLQQKTADQLSAQLAASSQVGC